MAKLIHSGSSTRVVAKAPWTCEGCGRERPARSTKIIITLECKVEAVLCVFCYSSPHWEGADDAATEAAHAGGIEDPFADEAVSAEVWEEVFGGVKEKLEKEWRPGYAQ